MHVLDRINALEQSPLEYIKHQAIVRPRRLWRDLDAYMPKPGPIRKGKVVSVYYLIKLIQLYERLRTTRGNTP